MKPKRNSLGKNALLNVIKQICSILFPIITFPYASRILGTVGYGKVNFSHSIISYMSLIAGLGITNYAIREGSRVRNDKQKLQKLANEVYTINIVSTFVSYIGLFALIIFWRRMDNYAALMLIQSMSVLFTTIGTDWINSIYEDYRYITIRYIVCHIISLALMFLLVRTEQDYIFYAFTSVSSTIVANFLNIKYIRKKYCIFPRISFSRGCLTHVKPILIMFGTAIASLVYINSDITILGVLQDDKTVGLYSASTKIYSLVKQLMNATLIVAIPRISYEITNNKKEEVSKHLTEIFGNVLIIIGAACAGLFMLSTNIIYLFSGIEFIEAASSLKILSVALIFATSACFYITVILVPYKNEKIALYASIISASVNIVFNFILIPIMGKDAAALTTLISELIMAGIGFLYSKKIVQLQLTRSLIIGFINAVITVVVCSGVKLFIVNNVLIILLSIILSVLCCTSVLLAAYKEKFSSVIHKIKHYANMLSTPYQD